MPKSDGKSWCVSCEDLTFRIECGYCNAQIECEECEAFPHMNDWVCQSCEENGEFTKETE